MEFLSNTLTITGISITTFLITLFMGNILKDKSNILLIIILLAFIPLFLSYNLTFINNENWVLAILPYTCFSLILIGPLLYEYAFCFFNVDHQKIFKKWKKYIPFFFACLAIFSSYFLLSKEMYITILIASVSFSFFHLFYYIIRLIKFQLSSTKKLKQFYANISNKDLFWINILIIGLFLVLILDSISGIIALSTGFNGIPIVNTLFLLILIWFLGYYGLNQKKITDRIDEFITPVEPEAKINLCKTKEYQELKLHLITILSEKELFKLEDINLTVLSQHLDVSSKKVSYLLNQCMNTSFYDLMNQYRLEEFKSKIEKGEIEEKTILGLAFESGFNSKASFNRIFKQKEGISPNEYIKSFKK